METSLSIVIPTMNRPDLLLRLLGYYCELRFRGKLLIGDSSNIDIFEQVVKEIRLLQNSGLQIVHKHLPGFSVGQAVMKMNEFIDTPYTCLLADDDFIVPAGAERCMNFLEAHSEYSAAHGRGILIASSAGRNDVISGASDYSQTVREESNAGQRILAHLGNYRVSLFSVHRTSTWQRMFRYATVSSLDYSDMDKAFSAELLPCCLSVVLGKIAEVDGLYLVRQVHDQRYLLPDWFGWINHPKWYGSYQYFREELVRALRENEDISDGRAGQVIDEAFQRYFSSMISDNTIRYQERMRDIAKKFFVFRWVWAQIQIVRDHMYGGRAITLKSLQRHSSPYYSDFKPIFRAVIGGK